MKHLPTVVMLLAACCCFFASVGEVEAQGRHGEAPKPAPPPAPRPAPVARTPSLSAHPAPKPSFHPAPITPKVNVPAHAHTPIQLPSNFQRPTTLPARPAPPVSLPKIDVIAKPPPRAPLKPTQPSQKFVERRPTSLPGAARVPSERRPDPVAKWSTLPHNQPLVRRPSAGGAVEFNKKLQQAWTRGRPAPNAVNLNVQRNHAAALTIQNHFRQAYRADPWFSQRWWNDHPAHGRPWWHYNNYWRDRPFTYWWRPATWALTTGWLAGNWGQPIYYDYGSNVIYRDNYVYINDVPVAPADVYASQAIDLASVAPPPEGTEIDWMPLGVFGLASAADQAEPAGVLQLAISKEGLISGTYYNTTNQQETFVEGRVDPDSQRLAIHFGDNPDVVLETGLYNLTQESTPVLIHFGTETTQTWFLVKMPAPPDQAP